MSKWILTTENKFSILTEFDKWFAAAARRAELLVLIARWRNKKCHAKQLDKRNTQKGQQVD